MLILVGELINTSRPQVKEAVEKKDQALIRELARRQHEAGATYIDVNCGNMIKNELDVMAWLVNVVQDEVPTPLCIDSPNAEALGVGLALCKNGTPMINSISDEDERYETVLPLIKRYHAKAVVLCMDSTGMPETADDRMKVVNQLYQKLTKEGIPDDHLYFDPLVKPISSVATAGTEVLNTITITSIKTLYPQVHFMCGLSNISYGLPNRSLLNRLFVVQTMALGMDGYVLDPTNPKMMRDITASITLLGQDKFCGKYIKAYKKGLLAE